MAKPTRLTILVWAEWLDKPAVQTLGESHDVRPLVGDIDLILHPGATRWHDRLDWWEALPEVIQDAKKRRKAQA